MVQAKLQQLEREAALYDEKKELLKDIEGSHTAARTKG